jgi:hypothetical protein
MVYFRHRPLRAEARAVQAEQARMQVSREELVESYRQFSDEELLLLVKAGSLTELAQEVAANEIRSRGLRRMDRNAP